KSGNSADIFTVIFQTPEGVSCIAEKKIFASSRAKGLNAFIAKWEMEFEALQTEFTLNKPSKIPTMIRFGLKKSASGMFGDVSAKLNDKGERLVKFNEVLVSAQPYEMDGNDIIIKFNKTSKKFSDIQTKFTVNMIAQEINDDCITWVDGDGEYPIVLETVSRRDNSPIEIGQGYSFIAALEKGKVVETESESSGWDDEVKVVTGRTPALVLVDKPLGRIKDYTMTVDFLGSDDAIGGF
ncbi:MAG: hypothetical protein ACRCZ9_10040, partial [Fusobacteriaceae bacterium]